MMNAGPAAKADAKKRGPINDEFLSHTPQFIADHPDSWSRTRAGAEYLQQAANRLRKAFGAMAKRKNASILTGVAALKLHDPAEWLREQDPAKQIRSQRLNSVMLFDRNGVLGPTRYDKIHVVLFGETVPVATGLTNNGAVLEVLSSKTGRTGRLW